MNKFWIYPIIVYTNIYPIYFNKIKDAGRKIKEWIEKVARRIRQMTGTTSADEVKEDSKEALKKIDDIGKNIEGILTDCTTSITELYKAYAEVADWQKEKQSDIKKDFKDIEKKHADDEDGLTYAEQYKGNNTLTYMPGTGKIYRHTVDNESKSTKRESIQMSRNGMDKISKDASDAQKKSWQETKTKVGLKFAEVRGKAEKISEDLKSLSKYGPLTKSATQTGYDRLRGIFNSNGEFGSQWKRIKAAADWATGGIKEALNKVISLYDVGIRATDAFGKRLSGGNFRDNKGEKMSKSDRKELMTSSKFKNKIYADKANRDLNYSDEFMRENGRLDARQGSYKNIKSGNANESAILDRLYQMAYQDAMEDIETREYALEMYDEIPGAYEFVEEGYDYDPDFDYDLI